MVQHGIRRCRWATGGASSSTGPAFPSGRGGGRGLAVADAKAVQEARRAVGAYRPPNGVATFLVTPTSSSWVRPSGGAYPGHRRPHTVVPALLGTDGQL